ncbi:MAG: DedA family protein [Anaerolineales bacterium]|nr:DedA family protein [Anaerolineales bacterium]
MTLETFVVQFGYPALLLGLLFEGETVLILGAFMAHRGYLSLPLVILFGVLAAFASDQFFFWMGRTQGIRFLVKRPAWKPHVEKAKSLLGRNTNLLFLGIRFMYGLRTVLPFVIGMSRLDPKKFVFLDFMSACLWAMTFGLAGHFIGRTTALIFEDVKEHEVLVVVVITLIGAGVWFYRRQVVQQKKGSHE